MIKLFCFPYAGGSATIFNRWKRFLDSSIELVPIELAGRGTRINENMYEDVSEAIQDILNKVKGKIKSNSYALYGHSMGAMLAYELALRIQEEGLENPNHIFFSGRGAPHIKEPIDRNYHLLNFQDFKKQVLELGGTPRELFEHPELLELFLPVLKNDFKLASTDLSSRQIVPLRCDISILLGSEEDITPKQSYEWALHTKGSCTIKYFHGDHFFLNNQVEHITSYISSKLLKYSIIKD